MVRGFLCPSCPARREKLLPHLTPDGSVQVGVEFRDHRPSRVHSVTIVTAQNSSASFGLDNGRFSSQLREAVIEPVLKNGEVRADPNTLIYVNSEDAFRRALAARGADWAKKCHRYLRRLCTAWWLSA
jgi:S-adenosylmethionine synthetase